MGVPAPPADAPAAKEPVPALLERLGADGVQRLRSRYAEVVARINERAQDPARRDELRASAERLNPDAWLTPEDVTRGLEEYETVFAMLRQVVGRKRRRRRRGRREGTAAATQGSDSGQAQEDHVEPAADDPDDFDEPSDDPSGGESGSGEL
ncbi:MAG TPA: hypothetical protein VH740_26510 [Vicinamibacterales bacterium]